eukprot:gnl/MRDRNA2_/MRDRNA2_58141_c0_seq1.p1 gnl/MRDRNA2_/MRDRNA2_58141_c0~~gnl/MRDRNA2_/MRDRNA2_58141_c0_seq1.p1  ORF type:complete len:152 (-),score=21.35 gnl/MRDRNA2_/MRDRNA2_58141_c0_seq1:32-487(-)
MRTITLIVLLDFIAQAYVQQPAASHTGDEQVLDKHVDQWVQRKVTGRALAASTRRYADLDDAILGKPCHLAAFNSHKPFLLPARSQRIPDQMARALSNQKIGHLSQQHASGLNAEAESEAAEVPGIATSGCCGQSRCVDTSTRRRVDASAH